MQPEIANLLLQQAPDALLLADRHGKIQFTNAAITSLFGYSPEELLGQSLELLLPERYRGMHQQHRNNYVERPAHRTMGQRGVPLFGRRRDSSEFPIWVSLSPIKSGDTLHIAAAIRDVTDWEELTQHLREASEEAKKASQTKSRFLATASHDLRQPLQVLQLLNASLMRKTADPDAQALITRQQHAIDTLTELLNALLDISKLESGTVKVQLEPVNALQLLSEVREQFESLVAAKNLGLETRFANVSLLTDRVLIRQLLNNLVGNSIKYTDQGKVSLQLLHTPQETTLEITDTGVGIPREQMARIFDAYYQPHAARPDRPGVGLGLAIVKQITELLGYGIQVESQPGKGTRFRITIPNDKVTTEELAKDQRVITTRPHSVPHGQYILIIEDDQAVREALELTLELEGFATLGASSAATAEELHAQYMVRIAAVVSDFHVDPQHTGVDIVTALRARSGKPLPAVFLTGDTSLALRTQQKLTASVLLNKPVDVDRLMQALSELLG